MRREDQRLEWATRNRRRPERARSAGSLVTSLADEVATSEAAAVKAAAGIAAIVDDEFRRHCRVAGVEHGSIIVHVSEPNLVGVMRLRWSAPLQAELARTRSPRGVRRVIFTLGRTGAEVR